jgi:hypothetical protein
MSSYASCDEYEERVTDDSINPTLYQNEDTMLITEASCQLHIYQQCHGPTGLGADLGEIPVLDAVHPLKQLRRNLGSSRVHEKRCHGGAKIARAARSGRY